MTGRTQTAAQQVRREWSEKAGSHWLACEFCRRAAWIRLLHGQSLWFRFSWLSEEGELAEQMSAALIRRCATATAC